MKFTISQLCFCQCFFVAVAVVVVGVVAVGVVNERESEIKEKKDGKLDGEEDFRVNPNHNNCIEAIITSVSERSSSFLRIISL